MDRKTGLDSSYEGGAETIPVDRSYTQSAQQRKRGEDGSDRRRQVQNVQAVEEKLNLNGNWCEPEACGGGVNVGYVRKTVETHESGYAGRSVWVCLQEAEGSKILVARIESLRCLAIADLGEEGASCQAGGFAGRFHCVERSQVSGSSTRVP